MRVPLPYPLAIPAESRPTNHILAALTTVELDRLRPDLEPYPFELRDVLYTRGQEMTHVYFPERGVVSLVTLMGEGAGVEAATIGKEGMAGMPVILGETMATARWVVQVPDGSHRIPREVFLTHLEEMPHFKSLVHRYAAALFDFLAQSSGCNASHKLTERCARWILSTDDRMDHTPFLLTQEYLAEMLGVRRPSVSIAASALQNLGLITYTRGNVTVLDRPGLEAASCECYAIIRDRMIA